MHITCLTPKSSLTALPIWTTISKTLSSWILTYFEELCVMRLIQITRDRRYRLEQTFCLVQLKGFTPLNTMKSRSKLQDIMKLVICIIILYEPRPSLEQLPQSVISVFSKVFQLGRVNYQNPPKPTPPAYGWKWRITQQLFYLSFSQNILYCLRIITMYTSICICMHLIYIRWDSNDLVDYF